MPRCGQIHAGTSMLCFKHSTQEILDYGEMRAYYLHLSQNNSFTSLTGVWLIFFKKSVSRSSFQACLLRSEEQLLANHWFLISIRASSLCQDKRQKGRWEFPSRQGRWYHPRRKTAVEGERRPCPRTGAPYLSHQIQKWAVSLLGQLAEHPTLLSF